MKMRVYEVAAELGVDSKTLLQLLSNLGYQVSGITSVLEESDSADVIRKIGSLRRMSLDDEDFKDQTVPGEVPKKVSHCLRCGKKLGVFRKRFRCTMCGAITGALRGVEGIKREWIAKARQFASVDQEGLATRLASVALAKYELEGDARSLLGKIS